MLQQVVDQTGDIAHDQGVREMFAVSGRLTYALMCLTLTWGVLTTTGWLHRLAGRQALRSGHLVLGTLTLGFAFSHVVALLFMRVEIFTVWEVFVPFNGGVKLQHTLGILAFEGMLAASVVVGVRRWLSYRQWLGIHRLSYVAFGCGVVHAFFGALNSGSLSTLWLIGITLLVPTVTIALVRFVPARALSSTGLFGDEP